MNNFDNNFSWVVSHEQRKMLKVSWSNGESFNSKHFCSKENIWWNLCFYPLGDIEVKREVVIHLCRLKAGQKVFVEGVIVLSSPSAKNWKIGFRHTLSQADTYVRVPLYGSLRDMYRYYPPYNDLQVSCSFNVLEVFNETSDKGASDKQTLSKSDVDRPPKGETDFQCLSYNLESLYRNKEFCDVTLRSGKFKLNAHMNILSSRSQTFADLFRPLTSSNPGNVVNLDKIDGDVLKEMIFYLYTGRTNKLNYEMAKDLCSAARSYDLKNLQKICSSYLASKLSVDSVLDLLVFADENREEELSNKSREFFSAHFKQIKQTDRWKSFTNDQPVLGVKVLSIMMESTIK